MYRWLLVVVEFPRMTLSFILYVIGRVEVVLRKKVGLRILVVTAFPPDSLTQCTA